MKATPILAGANHRRYIRSPTRMLSLLAGGLVLMLTLFVHAAPASAVPGLTSDETTYVTLLQHYRIVPAPGHTWWDLAQTGHQIVADVRANLPAYQRAGRYLLTDEQYYGCELKYGFPAVICEEWISSAIVVFAPDLAPPPPVTPWSIIPDFVPWQTVYPDVYDHVHGGPTDITGPLPYPHQVFPVSEWQGMK